MTKRLTSRLRDEPEDLGCDACLERLDVWADAVGQGVAGGLAEPTVAAHLRSCPDCAQDAEGLLTLLSGGSAPR